MSGLPRRPDTYVPDRSGDTTGSRDERRNRQGGTPPTPASSRTAFDGCSFAAFDHRADRDVRLSIATSDIVNQPGDIMRQSDAITLGAHVGAVGAGSP